MKEKTKNRIVAVAIAIAVIAIFLFGRGCGIKSVTKRIGVDTVVVHDSQVVRYKPKPYKVIVHDTISKLIRKILYRDTGRRVYFTSLNDTGILYNLETVYYDTIVPLRRGYVRIKDTLENNRIVGREIKSSSTDTIITKTVVLTQPKRFVLSIKASWMGNNKDWFHGIGVGAGAKLPNDVTVDYQRWWISKEGGTNTITIGLPLRIKKK